MAGSKNEGRLQHEDSTGEPVADEMTIEPKTDFRIQGISRAEVEQDEGKSRKPDIGRLVSAIMNHTNKNASITELQSKHPKRPFSEESEQMIRDVEGLELFEISPKNQCPHCMMNWMEGFVCLLWLRHLSNSQKLNRERDTTSWRSLTSRSPRCSSWSIRMLEKSAQEELRFNPPSFSDVWHISMLADEHRMDGRVLQTLGRPCTRRPLECYSQARTRKISKAVADKFKLRSNYEQCGTNCRMVSWSEYRHLLLHGRRLTRHGGHLPDGKSGECIYFWNCSKDVAWQAIAIPL